MGFRCSDNDFGGVPYSGNVFGVFVVPATVLVVALCSGVVLVLAVAPVSVLVVVICCSGDNVRGVVFSGFCLFVLFWWWDMVLAWVFDVGVALWIILPLVFSLLSGWFSVLSESLILFLSFLSCSFGRVSGVDVSWNFFQSFSQLRLLPFTPLLCCFWFCSGLRGYFLRFGVFLSRFCFDIRMCVALALGLLFWLSRG
ncbi:hypothetical protein TSUD_145790 [Trifolium subterraneum]|uniref:Uncharacterized protein n=1 Tax=Trifolium subterraneum TaxID=3900 RepID=A0A2Z6N9S2_TRISU|nr:hypothetical protein TSUD_145790 [Trifolium subterraneum]